MKNARRARWALSLLAALLHLAAVNSAEVESYAPIREPCPNRSLLRSAGTAASGDQKLNPSEAQYIERRRRGPIAAAFKTYMKRQKIGYDLSQLAPSELDWPVVGIAVSGGGFRASQVGAGTFDALDGRNKKAVRAGTGGVVQLASYMSGLSGGSWFVSSYAINDMPPLRDLVLGSRHQQGWFLEKHLALPTGALHPFKNRRYYQNLKQNVGLKRDAGFEVQFTDPWAIALAYKYGPGGTSEDNYYTRSKTKHNTPTQWTEIRDKSKFKSAEMPFPIVVVDSRPPGWSAPVDKLESYYIPLESNVYEFSPFEFGSWDCQLAHFVEVDYVGTNIVSGIPTDPIQCVKGFANFAFTIGTSSSLFNAIIQRGNATLLGVGKKGILKSLRKDLSDGLGIDVASEDDEVANYPNPFQGINAGTYVYSDLDELDLVDGGLAGANLPLDPLLVKARKIDTIVAVDGSADTEENWPDGGALRASYVRSTKLNGEQILPPIPKKGEFLKKDGYAKRPTFFGCFASDADRQQGMPFVIYLPNTESKDGHETNPSTYQLEYETDEQRDFLDAMFETTTRGWPPKGKNKDANWGDCLACAIVERRRQAAGLPRSGKCEKCFSRYCYDDSAQT